MICMSIGPKLPAFAMSAEHAEIPMIFLVGDVTNLHDHAILKTGLWDFVFKDII